MVQMKMATRVGVLTVRMARMKKWLNVVGLLCQRHNMMVSPVVLLLVAQTLVTYTMNQCLELVVQITANAMVPVFAMNGVIVKVIPVYVVVLVIVVLISIIKNVIMVVAGGS